MKEEEFVEKTIGMRDGYVRVRGLIVLVLSVVIALGVVPELVMIITGVEDLREASGGIQLIALTGVCVGFVILLPILRVLVFGLMEERLVDPAILETPWGIALAWVWGVGTTIGIYTVYPSGKKKIALLMLLLPVLYTLMVWYERDTPRTE